MRKRKPSQNELILKYMQVHKDGITPLQALKDCGCFDLAGRIRDLREQGNEINSEFVVVIKSNGEKTRVKRYWLAE